VSVLCPGPQGNHSWLSTWLSIVGMGMAGLGDLAVDLILKLVGEQRESTSHELALNGF